MVTWLGYTQTSVTFERPGRAAGVTKYPFRKMLRFAWDAILSFSSAPLRATVYLGLATFLFGIAVAVYSILRWTRGHTVTGWTSIMVLQGLIGGATLIGLGMIGEYIGRIYEESKQRPIYILRRASGSLPLRRVQRSVVPGLDPSRGESPDQPSRTGSS
jgi:dolichol-phosphate mannosyltransferase